MSTSAEDIAFEEGCQAYGSARITDNPYPFGSRERTAWFAGWELAQERGGKCDG